MSSIRPSAAVRLLRRIIGPISQARRESNVWLRQHCSDIAGDVLSIGSGTDSDGEGNYYKDYFVNAASYTTSEVSDEFDCDLVIDVRAMPQLKDGSYDCVFCSGVLEHVGNLGDAFAEITRILKAGGILLLGIPFRQAIHMPPHDYWRFTEHGIRHMLRDSYGILELVPIDARVRAFPATYWVKAQRNR
jgi:SAM-dependent methyltransferase